MAQERYEVRLDGREQGPLAGVFLLDEHADDDFARLTLLFPGGEITADADDYFEAMCRIRERLEPTGLRPVCFGSSRNVYPSTMSRDSGSRGLKAYKLQLGRPARTRDLVGIFDADQTVEPVSVSEQMQFFEQWMRSVTLG